MKYLKYLPLLIFLYACGGSVEIIPKKPNPIKYYNDFTGSNFLTAEQAATIENKLGAFKKETSNEIVVVIVNDFGGMEPAEFGAKLGAEWGVGQKETDNGVVLLVKTSEKRKVFISTGRGTETMLTDANAKDIVDNQIIPSFKSKDFYQGIDNGINRIISSLGGNALVPEVVPDATSNYSASENVTVNSPPIEITQDNQPTIYNESYSFSITFYLFLLFFISGVITYMVGWLFHGIDPRKGNIKIKKLPPTDLSPALLNSIINQEFKGENILKHALYSLAQKNIIKIKYNELQQNEFILSVSIDEKINILTKEYNPNNLSDTTLSQEEKTILKNLFNEKTTYSFPNESNEKYSLFIEKLKTDFELEHKNKYFIDNIAYWSIGLLMHVISIIFFLVNFSFLLTILYSLGVFVLFYCMAKLIHKYTKEGRKLMDDIQGFNLFLKQKDYDRIDYKKTLDLVNFDHFFVLSYSTGQIDNWCNHYTYIREKSEENFKLNCFLTDDDLTKDKILQIINSIEVEIKSGIGKNNKSTSTPVFLGGSSNSSVSRDSSDSWSSSDSGGSDFGGGDFGGGGAGGDW
jgi:uncharacterized membrane protein YgcG